MVRALPSKMNLQRCKRERLLDTRICDLPIAIEGTWFEPLIAKVRSELANQSLTIRPHVWISEEWFSPDGVPGAAIPFYLAHPRLMRLEREIMLEVEGGTKVGFTKLLRHEFGHAMQNAFQLHRRRQWQRLFGSAATPYPEVYRPRAASRDFVVHLDGWYAQSHPAEDFAETFAVWLNPRSRWRSMYRGWPALAKLEYVAELMKELRGTAPKTRSRARPYRLSTLKITLREHYRRRREQYEVGHSEEFDHELRRIFGEPSTGAKPASPFLRTHRRELCEQVARATGQHTFTVDQIYKQLVGRCRELKLTLDRPPAATLIEVALVLAVHTVRLLNRRGLWLAV